jgi:hypothetical protein
MVSRMFVAGRHLAVLSLLVFLLTFVVFPAEVSARNPYSMRDGHEGDPGDGVLSPVPVLDPIPTPKEQAYPVFTIMMVPLGDNQFIPVFQVVGYFGDAWFSNPKTTFPIVQNRGWHRAP